MKFTAAAFLGGLSLASAKTPSQSSSLVLGGDMDVPVESTLGRNLMRSARALENGDNYYYSWISGYSVKFDGCLSVPRFEREEGVGAELYAKFKLCPTGKGCSKAGEYVVAMREFVEAMAKADEETCEYQTEDCQYQCENGYYQVENANNANYQYQNNNNANGNNNNNNNNQNNNNNDNGEYCQYMCLKDAGFEQCANNQNGNNNGQDGGEEVNMDELSECRPMNEEEGNNNNNNNQYAYSSSSSSYQMYYVGAYCTSSGVYAGTFTDSMCTKHAPAGTYEKYNYGVSLPTTALVSTELLDCKAASNENQNNNNNNNNGNNNNYNNNANGDWNGNQILEVCEQLYEESIRCESNVQNTQYKDTSGCEIVHNIMPRMSSQFKNISGFPVAKFFAWVFGLGFFALGGYVYLLHKKVVRQKTELAA
eukprot:CAMPEP_0113500352 /NCGR_PEP_ID=MMETSP0014_2-20120614/32271_1 /TAXON_ID=2857 /ORGANISM="Nitzschia sp." /LENGTH=422 /DNA_ID=CAMNT_0000394659 /DNA_START=96 /DNA_END=1360 /DNA_ORIENTATION=+ /assembly_acc=CAM_ASM_000159